MARHLFGGRASDSLATLYPIGNAAVFAPPRQTVTLEVWDRPEADGGVQLTDLRAADGTTAVTAVVVPAEAHGQIPSFYGPDGVFEVWLRDPEGDFYRLPADSGDAAQAASTALAQVETARTDVEAMRDQVQAVVIEDLATSDGQMAALVRVPSSQTGLAIAAEFDERAPYDSGWITIGYPGTTETWTGPDGTVRPVPVFRNNWHHQDPVLVPVQVRRTGNEVRFRGWLKRTTGDADDPVATTIPEDEVIIDGLADLVHPTRGYSLNAPSGAWGKTQASILISRVGAADTLRYADGAGEFLSLDPIRFRVVNDAGDEESADWADGVVSSAAQAAATAVLAAGEATTAAETVDEAAAQVETARAATEQARDEALAHVEPLTAPANAQVASYIELDGATKSALTASFARNVSPDGTNGYPPPTGVGTELIFVNGQLDDIHLNGVSA
ncbi:hypothetical protein QWY28_17435 [Nocardioides sp. SOB77]|uniref:Minor tail protein n=1 Tax=Nocardioides oceani TaxID=3058369 RepID=A0ABT8FJ98_9ACTN|nr:hypothetical protein [Nocardioides oceani]MDN4174748.1 hypothetical protein [Nocardioides oceani]